MEVKNRYPEQFEGQEWENLIGNDEFAIKTAAYNLKMLNEGAASLAVPEVRAGQPLNQFLGSGYNAWGILENSARAASGGDPFNDGETEHGESTVNVVRVAQQILVGSGAYR